MLEIAFGIVLGVIILFILIIGLAALVIFTDQLIPDWDNWENLDKDSND